MKTISIELEPAVNVFSFRFALALVVQWIGALVEFILSMIASNIISPIPQFIMEKIPDAGFVSNSDAMLFNGAVNATILIWAARRSSLKGIALAENGIARNSPPVIKKEFKIIPAATENDLVSVRARNDYSS